MSFLQAATFIARKDISYLLRRRETILWTFVMPVLFFYFIGTVMGGLGPGSDQRSPLVIRGGSGGGFLVDEIERRLVAQNFNVMRPATDAEFAKSTRRLTIPDPAPYPTFTDAILAGAKQTITLEDKSDPLAGTYNQVRVSRAVYEVVADLAVVKLNGQTPSHETFAALAAMPRMLTLSVTSAGRRLIPPIGFAQAVPGTMVMFTMLVLLTAGSVSLIIEREQGLLKRLASTPMSPGAIVLGKWCSRLALGLLQIAFAMVLVVLFGWAAFSAGLAIVLANVARTVAQTAGLGVLAAQVLAALGGCWWPIEITPPWMQKLSLVLPTGIAMNALHKLVNFADPWPSALPHVVALLTGALVLGWIGTRIFKYQ
jgi:ABC-type Na+ efflux pump permease subunit